MKRKKIRNTIGNYGYINANTWDEYLSEANSIIDNLDEPIDRKRLERTLEIIKDYDSFKYRYVKSVEPDFKVETKI